VEWVRAAGGDGFAQVLVGHTPEAATPPELAELALPLRGDGAEGTTAAGANLNAATADGESIFTASAPAMWDSAGEDLSTEEKAAAPATGARVSQLDTRLNSEAITLEPDQDLLTDPATEYPVYIDPSVPVTRQAWRSEA